MPHTPRPTPTATLMTRETVVALNHHEHVPGGSVDGGESTWFAPDYLTISTVYTGRPGSLVSVIVSASDRAGRYGRWSSGTTHEQFRLRAIPESLRTLVLTFEPTLQTWVEWQPLEVTR